MDDRPLTQLEAVSSASLIFPERDRSFGYGFSQDGWLYMTWRRLFDFAVSPDGRKIIGRAQERAKPDSFETHLLSQVLSSAMLRVGIEPIHGTVLATSVGGVAILGDSGYGKSSLAASFMAAGDRLVTDDLLVVRPGPEGLMVMPGPQRMKLMPSTARKLLGRRAEGVSINDRTRKAVIPLLPTQVAHEPVPLKGIFALGRPARESQVTRTTARQLSQRAAFLELTKNSFNSLVVDSGRLQAHFAIVTEIATQVPVYRVSYPRGLSDLPAVRDVILEVAGR